VYSVLYTLVCSIIKTPRSIIKAPRLTPRLPFAECFKGLCTVVAQDCLLAGGCSHTRHDTLRVVLDTTRSEADDE